MELIPSNPFAEGKAMNNETPTPPPSDGEPFENVIFSYTRKQALADGVQVDVSATAKEAGFRIPVFITDTVYNEYVKVPADAEAQDEAGRLWDILMMLRHAIKKADAQASRLPFCLYVRNDNRSPKLVTLHSVCGALDIDDPAPSITIMLPTED